MRELKFRVWNVAEKRFIAPALLSLPLKMIGEGVLTESKDWIWQQFSCCSDSNGKPIFEGDWLRDNSRNLHGGGRLGQVVFQSGCFGILTLPGTMTEKQAFFTFDNFDYGETEVDGNILENP
jgi:hypothetical protein